MSRSGFISSHTAKETEGTRMVRRAKQTMPTVHRRCSTTQPAEVHTVSTLMNTYKIASNAFRSIKILSFLCLGIAFCLTPALPEESKDELTITASLDQPKATIGDLIHYDVIVTHRKDVKLLTPIKIRPEGLKIRSTKDLPVSKKGKWVTEGKQFTLTAFDTGEFKLEPVKIEYLDSAGTRKAAESLPQRITIESVLGNVNEKTDIKDIKGVLGIDPRYEKYLKFLYGLVGALLAGLLILFIMKKLKRKAADIRHLLNPYEEAMQRLSKLKESSLLEQGRVKLFYFKLTDILRHYFDRAFGFSTEELTTAEMALEISNLSLEDKLKVELVRFLEDCDLVKFANYKPGNSTVESDYKLARELINECNDEINKPAAPTEESNQ
jgi:hypothetical protein